MSYVLKILAGTLNGVEYTLFDGDTLFHVGPQQDLVDGSAARLLGAAGNAFFLPADLPAAAFMLRVQADADQAQVQLGERQHAHAAWDWQPMSMQQPQQAAGMHFAVRPADAAWSADVAGFVAPALPVQTETTAREHPPLPTARRRAAPVALLSVGAAVLLTLGATWFYWQQRPDTRVRGLASVLADAAWGFDILAGKDGRLYAFSDAPAGKAWGERASRRVQRRNDVHLLRGDEATRLEQLLEGAGLDVVVVRLYDPAHPEVVLSGRIAPDRIKQVGAALSGNVPYLQQAKVSAISDQQLVTLARQELRVRGISSRSEPSGQRVAVINDVFLDDAGLNAMAGTAQAFHARWGQRRISIAPQLWDDLLQGRSYRYSPGQLLSVGNGRWGYAGAASTTRATP